MQVDRKGTKAAIEADASTVGHSRIRGLLDEQSRMTGDSSGAASL